MKRKILYLIARALFFLPDSWMLRLQYFIKNKRVLHLKNPQRFTEKLEHYKCYYRNEDMQICTDKYAVRGYVEKKLGTDKYLNKLYQVCEKAEDIDFASLPNQFVIKTTDGGNGVNIVVCRDKTKLDIEHTVNLIKSWKTIKYEALSREWAYEWASKKGGERKPMVIVEQYLESKNNADGSIDDYKLLCYDGKFRFLWIDKNRYSNHKRGFWNEKLEFLDGVYSDHPTFDEAIPLPENIQEMIEVAEKLAKGFPFVRVDFYNIEGKIYFGEMTFYPWSSFVTFTPDSFDFELGKYFNINYNDK